MSILQWTYHDAFIHSISDGLLDCFQFGVNIKNDKINTFELNPWCLYVNISVTYSLL